MLLDQRRYEESVERNQVIMLASHTTKSKYVNEERKIGLAKPDIIPNMEKDSLTFMRTYRRCKHGKNVDFRRGGRETDTNTSRVSHESTNVVTSSHRNDHQPVRSSYSASLDKGHHLSRQSVDDDQYSVNSETQKTASVDMSNTLESLRESHAFSEVEVTIDNSISIEHFSLQPSKPYKIPPRPMQERRMSPDSLERQLLIELHYHDGLQASMEQLLQADRFQGVGFAQQETVSLAQILKARQWKDSRNNETNENLEKFTAALSNFNVKFSIAYMEMIGNDLAEQPVRQASQVVFVAF